MTRLGAPGNRRAQVSLRVGDMFAGKYRIEGLLGTGGMGVVLQAFHTGLERTVAIKVMHADLATDADSARRFSGEARAAAALQSPHAVRILDIDHLSDSGVPFIVMEHLEGADLGTVLSREGPIPYARAVDWIVQAMRGVAEAHARGFIHRDLKPQNLFLTRDGVVKVVDFGLAKAPLLSATASDSSGTHSKVPMGSPDYMSPEQFRSARNVDERTDIWALGATLFHLVAGHPPFVAHNVYLLCSRVLNEEAQPLRRLRPEVPAALEAVVQTCLRKDAQARYGSCAELEAALLEAMAEPSAPPHTRQVRTVRLPAKTDPTETAPMPTLETAAVTERTPEETDTTERTMNALGHADTEELKRP
jgi:eukaryotic-like serine/threonine-protein kinase